jgi:hypothetical protein
MRRRRVHFAQLVLATFLSHGNHTSADVITWSGNVWDHSSFGGSAASSGWQAGMQGGTTADASGITMTMQHVRFGTATAGSGNMSLQAFGATSYLLWSATNDFTSGGGTASNYGTVQITFSSPVLVSGFGLRDVDDGAGTQWQDFVSVSASNGGSNVGVTYSLGDPVNQTLSTHHGLNGVLGIKDVNRDPGNTTADLGFSFASAVNSITPHLHARPKWERWLAPFRLSAEHDGDARFGVLSLFSLLPWNGDRREQLVETSKKENQGAQTRLQAAAPFRPRD